MTDYVRDTIYAQHLQSRSSKRFLNNTIDNRTDALERFYRRKLTEMSIARFTWEGLPPSVDPLFLEKTLYYSSLAVFYFDPRYDQFMAVQATVAGRPNVTDNPTRFNLYGVGGYPRTPISAKHCVPVWGSITRTPDLDAVHIYARRFAELDRTIEINSKNARRTKVLVASENEKLSLANVDKSLERGDPAIYAYESRDGVSITQKVEAIDLGINMQDIERLHILKVRLWTECMEYLGINGGSKDKRERVQAAEVEANAEQVGLSRESNLMTRALAAEQINRKYPELNVSVRYATENDYTPAASTLDGSL